MNNLSAVNELHHPNDYRRLRKIALEAVRDEDGIPREEMKKAFQEAVAKQKLNIENFETFYPEYISTLEVMFDTLQPLYAKGIIPDDFNF